MIPVPQEIDVTGPEKVVKIRVSELRGEGDGRNVAGKAQSLAGRQGPPEIPVEIFRRVAGEAFGQIPEKGHGMDESLFKPQSVNKWLESRTWRTACQGSVYLAGN